MRFGPDRSYSGYGGVKIGPGKPSPFIKYALIANVALFVLQMLLGDSFTFLFGLQPRLFFDQFPNYIYQVFTYMYLHGGLWHLAFNMFVLWMFGTEIEGLWGSRRFAWFYSISGICGGILPLMTQSLAPAGLIIGASGAIYGVLIAYWFMFPNRMLYIWGLIPVKVKWAIPGFLLIGLLFGGSGVAHTAHLGGAIYGFIYMKADWRLTSFGSRIRNLRYKQQSAKLERRRQQAADTMKRIDSILDKINEVGIENISKDDRQFLEEASSRLAREKDEQKG